jgi:hypothetical protein
MRQYKTRKGKRFQEMAQKLAKDREITLDMAQTALAGSVRPPRFPGRYRVSEDLALGDRGIISI